MSCSHRRRWLPPSDCPAVDLPLKNNCKWLGYVRCITRAYIYTSFTQVEIYHQDFYLLHAAGKVELDYYRQSALNKSEFIQTPQYTDKAKAGFLSFDKHLAHEDDDILTKGKTKYFVISFLFPCTNWGPRITKNKLRCRLVTRQIID